MGGGGDWRKPTLSHPCNLSRSSLVFVWVLLAVHFRPSSKVLAVDRSGSHTFICAGSPLFANSVCCSLAGNFPFQTGSFQWKTQQSRMGRRGLQPRQGLGPAGWLLAVSRRHPRGLNGPGRTPPQKKTHAQSVGRQAVAGLLRPWLKRRLTARLSPCCVAIF